MSHMNQPGHTTPRHPSPLPLVLACVLGACGGEPAPGSLMLDLITHDFGQLDLGESGAAQVFTVRNTGADALDDLSVRLRPDVSFAVAATTCAGRLAPDATCTITVAFTPAQVGAAQAELSVEADRADVSAALTGVGTITVRVVNDAAGDLIVQSQPAGIRCGPICEATFTVSEIVLTAASAGAPVWSRPCATTPERACALALSGNAVVRLHGVLAPQWTLDGAQHTAVVTDAEDNVIVARFGSPSLFKLSPAGALVWQNDELDLGRAAAVDAQGNIGFGDMDGVVVKLDGAGATQWSVAAELTGLSRIEGMAFDPSGALFVAGAEGTEARGVRLVKLGAGGDVLWALTHAPGLDPSLRDLVVDGSGNVFISGASQEPGSSVYFVRKYDGDGTLLWERDDMDGELAVDQAGNLFIASEPRLHKLAPDGAGVWEAAIGEGVTGLSSLVATPAGDVILAGTRYADGAAVALWVTSFDGADGTRRLPIELQGEVPFFGQVAVDGGGDLVIAGTSDGFGVHKYGGALFDLPDE